MNTHKPNQLRAFLVALLAVLAMGLTQCQSPSDKPAAKETPPAAKTMTATPTAPESPSAGWKTAIAQVARENIPAVVHIDVTERREIANPMLPFGNDPFFRFFFNGQQPPQKFKQELRGLGTGMIIDDKGNILTNNHVVAGATEINVLLADGTEFPAKLVGTDPKTDLAVIHINADKKLPTVTFGDSDKIEVGDWVVAIGHPRGLDQTVTQGIISAKHRRGVLDPTSYQDYLQTDAAINPGNSGGPLLNLDGQVVGVNAAIASQSGGFEGIGFAIPSNMAVHVAKALIDHGKVVRGWLGVSIRDLTPKQVKSMNLAGNKGALIADVVPNSPAANAGIQKNDLVVKFQGEAVDDAAALQRRVGDTPVGDTATLTVMRDGKSMALTVTIGSQEDAMRRIAASLEDRLGVVVRPLKADEVRTYGLEAGQGVALASVDPHAPWGRPDSKRMM
ncbi:Do family serine endopeptidase [Desulfosarcina cetonica]|uniref:Do family serine endopeptidase n=1 Tax=Desulfosarcina cetonica TaxID=90730 RepID=UPI0006D2A09D|nr:Do family serine endopeptidase [Desulfosarcina cetonica]